METVDIGIMPTAEEELAWIDAAKRGDKQAFSRIVATYSTKVAGTVKGMLGDSPEAEDVGQEVFISLYRSLDRFRGESSLGTFLTRIAINHSLNEFRRKKRWLNRSSRDGDGELQKQPAPGDDPQTHQRREAVRKAIRALPARFRSVVVLRLIQEHSTQETAAILDLPLGTVQSRLARAQKKLKELLSHRTGGEHV